MLTSKDLRNAVLALRRAGRTQQAIADACGCSNVTIHRIEHGRVYHPRLETINGIMTMHAELKKLEESQCQPT